MDNIETSQEKKDFMFYETFFDSIQDVQNLYDEDTAEKFALAIIRFGVEGKEFDGIDDDFLKATLINIYPQIVKSQERNKRKVMKSKSSNTIPQDKSDTSVENN